MTAIAKPKKFRYYCPACTGRAFYAPEKIKFTSVNCQNCGAVVEYDEGNWLEITDPEEYQKVNGVAIGKSK